MDRREAIDFAFKVQDDSKAVSFWKLALLCLIKRLGFQ